MKITFSGDICASKPLDSFTLSQEISSLYGSSDFNIACLEAPAISSELEEYKKIGPCLLQNKDSLEKFINNFSHVSLANNHAMDYGRKGLEETIEYLTAKSIQPIGAGCRYPDMYKPAVLEKDGIKVALFCWAESQYGCCRTEEQGAGYAWLFNPMTYRLIEEYRKECDYVILFLHAGLEDVDHPIIEWRNQYRAFIDYGVDLVVANHPHAIQGVETYSGKKIYYSLGNFFFNGKYANESSQWTNSILLECDINKEGISTTEHFVHFCQEGISLSAPEIPEHFAELSELLKPENFVSFKKIHDEMIMDCWESYYKSYYSWPIWKIKPPVVFYRRWFNKLMYNYAHHCFEPPVTENKIYHNINIETHRFVVARVCSMLAKTY